jgi:hypothetical protein
VTRIILIAILVIAAITVLAGSRAKAAMEEEEIWVRLTTGQSVKVTVNPRRPIRRRTHRHQR